MARVLAVCISTRKGEKKHPVDAIALRLDHGIVGDAHAYTRSKVPWRLDTYRDAYGETSKGARFGWKLFHYISGGGMRTFGRTVQQEELNARQNRFLVVAGLLAALWLALLLW